MLAVVRDGGEVLHRGPPVRRLREDARRRPPVRRREGARPVRRRRPGQAGPLLAAAAVARADPHRRSVGRTGVGGLQAQPGLHCDDRAVGVHPPLLVRAAGAGPDLHPGTGGGGMPRNVQALVAVHGQLVGVRRRPLLVGPAPAVVHLQERAVGLAAAHHVETPVGGDAAQGSTGGCLRRGGDEHRRQRGQSRDDGGEHRGRMPTTETSSVHGNSLVRNIEHWSESRALRILGTRRRPSIPPARIDRNFETFARTCTVDTALQWHTTSSRDRPTPSGSTD